MVNFRLTGHWDQALYEVDINPHAQKLADCSQATSLQGTAVGQLQLAAQMPSAAHRGAVKAFLNAAQDSPKNWVGKPLGDHSWTHCTTGSSIVMSARLISSSRPSSTKVRRPIFRPALNLRSKYQQWLICLYLCNQTLTRKVLCAPNAFCPCMRRRKRIGL